MYDYIEELRPGLPEIMTIYEMYVDRSMSGNVNYEGSAQLDMQDENQSVEMELKEENDAFDSTIELESEVQNIREELHLAYDQIVELAGEIEKLKGDYRLLKERYNQLQHLYTNVNNKVNSPEKDKLTQKVNPDKKIKRSFSLDQFTKVFKEVLGKYDKREQEFIESQHENMISEIYGVLFYEDSTPREEILSNDTFQCPLTKNTFKTLKPLIKNTIRCKIDETIKDKESQLTADI